MDYKRGFIAVALVSATFWGARYFGANLLVSSLLAAALLVPIYFASRRQH